MPSPVSIPPCLASKSCPGNPATNPTISTGPWNSSPVSTAQIDANLTGANNGQFDFTGLINFNITPFTGGFGTDAGDFQQPDYPDALFPGLPSNTGLNGSSAENIVTYLQFASPGIYQFGVNSDDGFLMSEGKSPNDWFANQLGSYNGGKGSSDVLFA